MAAAEFRNVYKRFGGITAVDDVSLRISDGESVVLLGPSGCGKSTLLRLAAGLDRPTGGSIRVGDRPVDALPPHQRDIAMVFQSYALYPHLTARGNIEFPLRMRGVPRAARHTQTEHIAGVLGLSALLDRRPAALSGGERQRVALARALVRHPALFLLDEPLSNLDARLRLGVRQFLRSVQRRLHVTTLYVTHDQSEAMTLGDRVAVMRAGRIQQIDTPAAIYERPANAFVASFVGSPPMNLLHARYADGALLVGDVRVGVPSAQRARLAGHAGPLLVGIRPEAFTDAPDDVDGLAAIGDPTTLEVLGSETLVRATVGRETVTVRFSGIVRDLPLRLTARFDAFHLFADDAAAMRLGGGD